jgi:hypothetical protein
MALDDDTRQLVRSVCETIVPGSTRVGPEVYVEALLTELPEPDRAAALAAFAAVAAGERGTPAFMQARALAIEAFYSDFVAPGLDAEGAWAEIDFNSPIAQRVRKDWSYLGIG